MGFFSKVFKKEKTFEDLNEDIKKNIIMECLNFSDNQADVIYVIGLFDYKEIDCDFFYNVGAEYFSSVNFQKNQESIYQKIKQELSSMKDLYEKNHQHLPTIIKIIYHVKTKQIETEIESTQLYGRDKRILMRKWFHQYGGYSKEELSIQYKGIADTVSHGNDEMMKEAREIILDTNGYTQRYKERYEDRGLDISTESEEVLQWIGLVDMLISHGYALELDYKCEVQDFEQIYKLRQLKDLKLKKPSVKLNGDGDVEQWCAIIDKKWKGKDCCIACIDIKSDSYILFPIKRDELRFLERWMENMKQTIKRVAEDLPSIITKDMAEHVIEVFKEETKRDSVVIKLCDKAVKLTDSKFGGIPYMPQEQEVPHNKKNQEYQLLAQIRMDDLPSNTIGLPHQGMLQFWVLDEDVAGLDGDYEVIYYPTIDEAITLSDIEQKYHPRSREETELPLRDEFSLTFELIQQGMSTSDYQFDKTFTKIWNKVYPDEPIGKYDDLGKELNDLIYDHFGKSGHRIGGYPYFTQYDIRETDSEDYQILLFQMDSDQLGNKEIMWGDCGIANFFITEKDLKKLDFSKVIYSWDCC